MRYTRRIIDDELDELFGEIPAIVIDGPKAVGKTTTAEQRVRGLLRLDAKANREAVHADPNLLLSRARPLLIDEWQQVPEVWDVVRRAVDDDPSGGQFLLVGSATPRHGATAHSGAGRIGRIHGKNIAALPGVRLKYVCDPSGNSVTDGQSPRIAHRQQAAP